MAVTQTGKSTIKCRVMFLTLKQGLQTQPNCWTDLIWFGPCSTLFQKSEPTIKKLDFVVKFSWTHKKSGNIGLAFPMVTTDGPAWQLALEMGHVSRSPQVSPLPDKASQQGIINCHLSCDHNGLSLKKYFPILISLWKLEQETLEFHKIWETGISLWGWRTFSGIN